MSRYSQAEVVRAALLTAPGPVVTSSALRPLQAWPCYVSSIPDKPDNAVCVYDTSGVHRGRLMKGGERITHYGIQVMIRSEKYISGWNKAYEIALILDKIIDMELRVDEASPYFLLNNIRRTSDVVDLGESKEERRRKFTINALVVIPNLMEGVGASTGPASWQWDDF